MIAETIQFICDEINASQNLPKFVVMGNVAYSGNGVPGLEDDLLENVVATLVNIEEEKTLKNGPHYVQNGESLSKRNPTIFLNLYLLFSCADSDYFQALRKIQNMLLFFQKQYVFNKENAATSFPTAAGVEKIILDLFTLNFEQINHLWGILGGKYTPSVLYKLRIVAVQNADPEEVAEVKEIKADANAK